MTTLLLTLLGGVGLFLLGMTLITDGLKAFAGEALRRILVQFTGTPLKAFGSGAVTTLLVQSSSATTVAVIGFVSAGLLTFPQAVGLVMGASLGTTGTGWLVAAVGLKISVGLYALPIVGVGAFIKLLAAPRWQHVGMALAGFGIIFLGIEVLQGAMGSLSGVFDLAALPSGGAFSALMLVLVGAGLTIIMQSSSATVATILTALHTESINFDQAAALVIGAAIGTTATGVLVALGGGVPARRTALAHVLFNAATGAIALGLLPVFLRLIGWLQVHAGLESGAVSLAAFHTAFIGIGVLIFLPWAGRLSKWIERMLPEKGPPLTRHLDSTLLEVPAVALEATLRALRETAEALLELFNARISARWSRAQEVSADEAARALHRIQHFVAGIPPMSTGGELSPMKVAQLHAIDHLVRLQSHLQPSGAVQERVRSTDLDDERSSCEALLTQAAAGLRGEGAPDWIEQVRRKAAGLSEHRRLERPSVMNRAVAGEWDAREALEILDAMRWLDTTAYHTWRIVHYLGEDDTAGLTSDATATPESVPDDPPLQASQRP